MKGWLWGLLPVAVILLLLTGCEGGGRIETWREGDMTIYARDGLEVPVPSDYVDLLSITFSDPPGSYESMPPDSAHIRTLFSCREKASMEAGEKDHPGEDRGDGWLFSICKLDQIGLEEWLVSDGYGSYLFARDDGGYYLSTFPTDSRLYREGGELPEEDAEEWDVWYLLNEWSESVPDAAAERSGALRRYDAFSLYRREYTYGGAHAEIEYTPEDGIGGAVLVLSQPVRQGKGGVWCVERIKYICDGWTDTRLVFPVGEGIDMTAEAYYNKLQSESAKNKEFLTPMGAALSYARRAGWVPENGGEKNLTLIAQS